MGLERQTRGRAEGLRGLESLREFDGSPTAFWPAFLRSLTEATEAAGGVLVIQSSDGTWKPIALHPQGSALLDELHGGGASLEDLCTRGKQDGVTVESLAGRSGSLSQVMVANVTPIGTATPAVAVLHLSDAAVSPAEEAMTRLRLGREVASVYSLQRRLSRVEETVGSYAAVLDLLRVLDSRRRYLEACMTLCNEVSSRFRAERVSLGWLTKGSVRLQAISHTEKIEKKMQAVLALEEVMEEAFDQDEEVMIPAPVESDAITRSHEKFSREQGVAHLVSFPIRLADQPEAVLTLERSGEEFEEGELRSLRLLCDQVAVRLAELRRHDGWIGARCWNGFREQAGKLMGVQHTGWKLVGLLLAVVLAVLIFGGGVYRVEAPFLLKTETVAQIPAAFEGYIKEVHATVGDRVGADAPLVDLDQRQLLVEEASALAELRRHRSDAQRAEAEGDLGKMRSSLALAEQSEAKLEIVRLRLSQARMVAPFEGVVVEGDLRERIGSPAQQGEVLLKVARLDQLYVEGKVNESNIHLLEEGARGEIAFASRPQDKFEVEVERIEPLAVPEEEGNVFVVRCRVVSDVNDWWRPGMSGLCKLETERRSYLWMLTHRTVDFLRMKLWW